MEEQVSLFEYVEKEPINNALGVYFDGEFKDVSWNELFDTSIFDTLKCVTYVSSGSFFEKSISGFSKVDIIIGIEKGDIKRAFDESIRTRMCCEGDKIFSDFSDDTKERIINNSISIRYSLANNIIHSKMYLLSNSETGKTRFIFGSANLTASAFSNDIHQFEDIMVWDNNLLFETYNNRFEAIRKNTVDYISEETKEKYKVGKLISIVDFTPEEKTEKLLDVLKNEKIVPLINEVVYQQVQESQDVEEQELVEVKAYYEVISAVSKKSRKTGKYEIKTPLELESIKPKIVELLYKGTKQELEMARFTLNYNDADKKQYHIYTNDNCNQSEREAELYDRRATNEEIKASMENLNKFILAYKEFVSTPDVNGENLSHILETIFYAFTASYIFMLRKEALAKNDIPIMLVIGGRAASGKSSLLAYIDALLSGRRLTREEHYYAYEKVATGKNSLANLFMSENTYPLLVDEIPPSFFNSTAAKKGETLIKYLSNTLSGKHPAMICTTNTDTFNIPAQFARRIYYLQVDACFDEIKYKGQASEYYERVLNNANNILFRDFCYRMGEKLAYKESLFGEDKSDFLYCARQIFIDYFNIAGIDIPSYMPQKLYRDYSNRGREMWKVLFQQDQNSFKYKSNGKDGKPELIVNLKEITSGTKDTSVYLNYLKQDLLVESAGIYTIIHADGFFKWIGIKNPWEKKSLFKKLFDKTRVLKKVS